MLSGPVVTLKQPADFSSEKIIVQGASEAAEGLDFLERQTALWAAPQTFFRFHALAGLADVVLEDGPFDHHGRMLRRQIVGAPLAKLRRHLVFCVNSGWGGGG